MTGALDGLVADLAAEHASLDAVCAGLGPEQWIAPTPADGWAVRDEISHLAYFDGTAVMALERPEDFAVHKAALFGGELGTESDVTFGRSVPGSKLLASWRTGRADLIAAGKRRAAERPAERVSWYGPDMSLTSFLTARLMETWAHGQDVRDAVGAPASATDRLRHICFIGAAARRYTFMVHGVADPGTPVRVEAVAPDGSLWHFGPEDAAESIRGSALGLALVFTQRRHPDDTDVVADGATAEAWLGIAQAFAGPAGPGRAPGLGFPAVAAETKES